MDKNYLIFLCLFPTIYLQGGANLSVQASAHHEGCAPRSNKGPHTHVEVNVSEGGWDVADFEDIRKWTPKNGATNTFELVPIEQVAKLVERKGIDFIRTFEGHVKYRASELQL